MQYRITRYCEGLPFLAHIVSDAVQDNYTLGIMCHPGESAITVFSENEEEDIGFLSICIQCHRDDYMTQALTFHADAKDPHVKELLSNPVGKHFKKAKDAPSAFEYTTKEPVFFDKEIVLEVLRTALQLADTDQICARTYYL